MTDRERAERYLAEMEAADSLGQVLSAFIRLEIFLLFVKLKKELSNGLSMCGLWRIL